jgi:hypothetical protein
MLKEWLLIVWLGTSTNFTIQGVHWSLEDCQRARDLLIADIGTAFVVICTQDLTEGRSRLPKNSIGVGIVR